MGKENARGRCIPVTSHTLGGGTGIIGRELGEKNRVRGIGGLVGRAGGQGRTHHNNESCGGKTIRSSGSPEMRQERRQGRGIWNAQV